MTRNKRRPNFLNHNKQNAKLQSNKSRCDQLFDKYLHTLKEILQMESLHKSDNEIFLEIDDFFINRSVYNKNFHRNNKSPFDTYIKELQKLTAQSSFHENIINDENNFIEEKYSKNKIKKHIYLMCI